MERSNGVVAREAERVAEEAVQRGRVQENVVLQPIAAPSIMGLYGYAAGQFAVAAGLIGWYPASAAPYIFPFAALLAGVVQFAAAMWAFRARDSLATAMLGVWGGFWIAFGILNLLFAAGVLALPGAVFVGLGFWFIPLAVITYTGAMVATRVNWAIFAVLFLLATGAAVAAAGNIAGNTAVIAAAGWLFLLAAVAAWYAASALLFKAVFRREILPLGSTSSAPAMETGAGEPGVMRGQ